MFYCGQLPFEMERKKSVCWSCTMQGQIFISNFLPIPEFSLPLLSWTSNHPFINPTFIFGRVVERSKAAMAILKFERVVRYNSCMQIFQRSLELFVQWTAVNEWRGKQGIWLKLRAAVGAIDGTSVDKFSHKNCICLVIASTTPYTYTIES